MKKFINYFICSIVFMLGCGVLASCGSDDDKDKPGIPATASSLIGTWQTTYPDGGHNDTETITFNKNGTLTSVMKCPEYGTEKASGKWRLDGDPAKGALLTISGRDLDGYDFETILRIQIIENVLVTIDDEEGETVRWNRK
ncbi:glycoside hydrolase family 43 C-terminal domain-containing protein [uncultured Muribaculum sp.]|uniref:glycoside hydrolase family 43 C-terminal domain-containing protein n=1 Tax=uncultured Muribaculum sp. TaxID=1918613 RepID=UPI00266FAFEB|nr:glycoside hydrolase family 43 C-terminal domain-containing protein [uncultured Muribaculum sp.]